jgi:hypothetical protein
MSGSLPFFGCFGNKERMVFYILQFIESLPTLVAIFILTPSFSCKKRGVIQSLVNGVSLLCQNEQDQKTEMKIVRKDLLPTAYPTNLVESIMCEKSINQTEFNNSNGRPLGMGSIPYSRGVAEKLRRICKC